MPRSATSVTFAEGRPFPDDTVDIRFLCRRSRKLWWGSRKLWRRGGRKLRLVKLDPYDRRVGLGRRRRRCAWRQCRTSRRAMLANFSVPDQRCTHAVRVLPHAKELGVSVPNQNLDPVRFRAAVAVVPPEKRAAGRRRFPNRSRVDEEVAPAIVRSEAVPDTTLREVIALRNTLGMVASFEAAKRRNDSIPAEAISIPDQLVPDRYTESAYLGHLLSLCRRGWCSRELPRLRFSPNFPNFRRLARRRCRNLHGLWFRSRSLPRSARGRR